MSIGDENEQKYKRFALFVAVRGRVRCDGFSAAWSLVILRGQASETFFSGPRTLFGGFFMQKFNNFFFSPFLREKNAAKKCAYVAMFTAITVVCNGFLEFKILDTQFSFTVFVSFLVGILAGGGAGFVCCVAGDLIGYLINSAGLLYMAWVGLSTGCFSLIAGVVFHNLKGGLIFKTVLYVFSSFVVCTILINTTGFYFYSKAFNAAVFEKVAERFGDGFMYGGYLLYRLFVRMQIFNSLFNYALVAAAVPVISRVKIQGKSLLEKRFDVEKIENTEKGVVESNNR